MLKLNFDSKSHRVNKGIEKKRPIRARIIESINFSLNFLTGIGNSSMRMHKSAIDLIFSASFMPDNE